MGQGLTPEEEERIREETEKHASCSPEKRSSSLVSLTLIFAGMILLGYLGYSLLGVRPGSLRPKPVASSLSAQEAAQYRILYERYRAERTALDAAMQECLEATETDTLSSRRLLNRFLNLRKQEEALFCRYADSLERILPEEKRTAILRSMLKESLPQEKKNSTGEPNLPR